MFWVVFCTSGAESTQPCVMFKGISFLTQHEWNSSSFVLPVVPKIQYLFRIRRVLHVFIPDDLSDRHAYQRYGWVRAWHIWSHENAEQISKGGGLWALEQNGFWKDNALILQFQVAGTPISPIIRPIRNNEIMGRDVFFRRLQKIFLPLLLLHCYPEIPQINNHEIRFCKHPTCNPKAERCECVKGDRDSSQIVWKI